MKKLIIFLFLLTIITSAFAQQVTVGPGEKPLLKSLVKIKIEGSPYFNNEYTNGKIETINQKEFEVKNLRYNLETQQLEYTEDGNIYAVQDSVQSFTLADSLGIKHTFNKLKSGDDTGFYETVTQGNAALLKQYTVKKETTQDWFTKKTIRKNVVHELYFTNKEGIIKTFNPSLKSIASILSDQKNQVIDFIKNEQLDPKKDDDLAKIFSFYNTLKSH